MDVHKQPKILLTSMTRTYRTIDRLFQPKDETGAIPTSVVIGRSHVIFPFYDSENYAEFVSYGQILLRYSNGKYIILDISEFNTTYINTSRLDPNKYYVLNDGDMIVFGIPGIILSHCPQYIVKLNIETQTQTQTQTKQTEQGEGTSSTQQQILNSSQQSTSSKTSRTPLSSEYHHHRRHSTHHHHHRISNIPDTSTEQNVPAIDVVKPESFALGEVPAVTRLATPTHSEQSSGLASQIVLDTSTVGLFPVKNLQTSIPPKEMFIDVKQTCVSESTCSGTSTGESTPTTEHPK